MAKRKGSMHEDEMDERRPAADESGLDYRGERGKKGRGGKRKAKRSMRRGKRRMGRK